MWHQWLIIYTTRAHQELRGYWLRLAVPNTAKVFTQSGANDDRGSWNGRNRGDTAGLLVDSNT